MLTREEIDNTIKIKGIKLLMRKGIMVDTDDKDLLLFVDDIKAGLHSQGVVIKVDRELPIIPSVASRGWETQTDSWRNGCANGQRHMVKAGYVAVESLIKEERDG